MPWLISVSLGLSALPRPLASAVFLNPDDQSRLSQLTSMLRAGAILLTVWTGLKLAISLGILFMLLVLGKNSPALLVLYGDAQGKGLDPRALATINGLAVVANASIAALSIMSLIVIWAALVRRAIWAFWSLATALLFLEVVRWLGESFFYQENLLGDAATLLPTLAGITCAAIGLFRRTS